MGIRNVILAPRGHHFMSESLFTWLPIYQELAKKLPAWRTRQVELIDVLRAAVAQGVPGGGLSDEDKDGKSIPLRVIDPFTFFAFFNRKLKDQHRVTLLRLIKDKFGLNSPLPTDFTGIPILNPQRTWYFSYEKDREPDAISTLWDFAEAIVKGSPESVPADLFTRCLNIQQVGLANLTMGLFWIRPDQYMAIDSQNRDLLKANRINFEVENWASYLDLLKRVKQQFPGDSWPIISQRAFEANFTKPRYWLFQASPVYYDLPGALKANALQSWSVNQHRKEIHKGDRLALWLSGPEACICALATVTSEVREIKELKEESEFNRGSRSKKTYQGVKLKVDHEFSDNPISKEILMKTSATKNIPIGHQGTNFTLTEKQFQAIEALAPAIRQGQRYWLYAPGPSAKLWDECQQSGRMLVGFDGVGKFSDHVNQPSMLKALKKTMKEGANPTNDALGAWEFLSVVKPGDTRSGMVSLKRSAWRPRKIQKKNMPFLLTKLIAATSPVFSAN